MFAARILGPSDLYQNLDQSKTASFTADMVLHGRWALPIDATGQPSRKPPLYNWLDAPLFAAGWHSEIALKLPSLLAGLATIGFTFVAARRVFGRAQWPMACAAACIWIAAPENAKHIYFCRPDMLLIALLTAGWLCAMSALNAPPGKLRTRWLVAMWVLTGLAVLTKGPAAALIPIYASLHALWIGARTEEGDTQRGIRPALRLGWWWGLPTVAAMAAAWLIPAYLQDPQYVRTGLLGKEMAGRLDASAGAQTIGARIMAHMRPIMFHVERFAPWSVLSLAALFMLGPINRWRAHATVPVVLWMCMVLGVMTVLAGKGGSYVAPAYPAAAILAAFALEKVLGGMKVAAGRRAGIIAGCALIVGTSISAREVFWSRGARTGTGDAIAQFARQAGQVVGDDVVVFDGLGYVPIPTLMGRHQVGAASAELLGRARWVIMPMREGLPEASVLSAELRRLRAQDGRAVEGSPRIGLWAVDAVPAEILRGLGTQEDGGT
ncbi:MAG: glycosyltransferase family 39 protein [Phycisphaerales bacterium]|nr:glycosyltransferase family 39 protein [Phycisphaerales bacterium]